METNKPIKIETNEWWFKGCFIQKQFHPELKPYHVFKDTEKQETVDSCLTFGEAKSLCKLHEVKDCKHGYKPFLL
jgi:hypothetical protein